MRITEIITEGREANLYHGMTEKKSLAVLHNDSMPALWQHNVPGMGRVAGNSLSRNKFYGIETVDGDYSIRLVLDQARLAQTHKMFPVDGELLYNISQTNQARRELNTQRPPELQKPEIVDPRDANPENSDRYKTRVGYQMSEEFVVGNINQLHRYIKEIQVLDKLYWSCDTDLGYLIDKYSKKFRIPLTGSPEALANVKRAANRAKRTLKNPPTNAWRPPTYDNYPHPDPAPINADWDEIHGIPKTD